MINNSLQDLLAKAKKKYGEDVVADYTKKFECLALPSLSINAALGGGIPKGCITEIYGWESAGKTTIALYAAAAAQEEGKIVIYVDVECAIDFDRAKLLGVDISPEKFIVLRPTTAEEALGLVKQFVTCDDGSIGLIVLDSVAAMVAQCVVDGEVGEAKMGVIARMMSQTVPTWVKPAEKNNIPIIAINQLREKIGVMFGCLHYDTKINFVDGRSIPIGKVVKEQIGGKVWSWNESKNEFEPKQIIDWHHNGYISSKEDFIHLETKAIHNRSRFGLTVTPDHKIMTEKGWKCAKEVQIGDKCLSKYPSIINSTLKYFLAGSLVGDCYLYPRGNNGSLHFKDSENPDYLSWKISKLSKYINFSNHSSGRIDSEASYEFLKIKKELDGRNPKYFFDNYSDLGLALWYMDDGSFDKSRENGRYRSGLSIKRFKNNEKILTYVKNKFLECFGIECTINIKAGYFSFNKENSDILFSHIAKYVPDAMQYKLHPDFQGLYQEFELDSKKEFIPEFVEVVSKRICSDKQFKAKGKFDISIEGNHNYSVGGKNNGLIVHNSPETTNGGNALKFYSSVRVNVSKSGKIEENGERVGHIMKIRIDKNKVAIPSKKAEVNFNYATGIDLMAELIDLAEDLELVDKKGGGHYSYNGTKIGQGMTKAKLFLEDNPDILEEIQNKVIKVLNS